MVESLDYKKKIAGEKAVEFIKDGMIVGLGSGSTAYWMLKKLGECVKEGLQIEGVPSSKRTEGWANEFGIPLTDFTNIKKIDIAIDGADEIDKNLNLIKGGGGSLVREKIVDAYANKLIIISEESKIVSCLGNYPLPVEVVPFGWEVTAKKISNLGCKAILRKRSNETFVSNNGNYIVDCKFVKIADPKHLHEQLKKLVGVVETGLFVDMTDMVIIRKNKTTEIITKSTEK